MDNRLYSAVKIIFISDGNILRQNIEIRQNLVQRLFRWIETVNEILFVRGWRIKVLFIINSFSLVKLRLLGNIFSYYLYGRRGTFYSEEKLLSFRALPSPVPAAPPCFAFHSYTQSLYEWKIVIHFWECPQSVRTH